jgi:hypothetical protein
VALSPARRSGAYDQSIGLTTLRDGLFKAVDLCFAPRPVQRSSTHHAAVLLCIALAYMKPAMVTPFPNHWWWERVHVPIFYAILLHLAKVRRSGLTYYRHLLISAPLLPAFLQTSEREAYTPLPPA